MKLCKDCKWYSTKKSEHSDVMYEYCHHESTANPVCGETGIDPSWQRRDASGTCGREGKYWETRSIEEEFERVDEKIAALDQRVNALECRKPKMGWKK